MSDRDNSVNTKMKVPTLEVEFEIAKKFFNTTYAQSPEARILIAGVDEVGRGCIAGPVAVGVCVLEFRANQLKSDLLEREEPEIEHTRISRSINLEIVNHIPPEGLADSKILSEKRRTFLYEPVRHWGNVEVGYSSPAEIDQVGIMGSIRFAALRALHKLAGKGLKPDAILLDGSHNWIDFSNVALDMDLGAVNIRRQKLGQSRFNYINTAVTDLKYELTQINIPVHCLVKADQKCASVAAASVVAKVDRDRLMAEASLWYPQYEWEKNKGYSSKKHILSLQQYGPCPEHRISWRLPGVDKNSKAS